MLPLHRSKFARGFQFDPLRREGVVVEAEARRERVDTVWLIRQPRDIVGICCVEAAVETGIGGAAVGERVLSEHVVGLPEQRAHGTGLVELRRVLHAVVGPAAAFNAIPAGVLIDAEQIAVIKHQALRIFGWPTSDLLFVWPDDHLRDRFYRLRAP